MADFAEEFVKSLKGGDILALRGDLGSGKTTFTKGLARALGITSEITSPTFVILKEYQIKNENRSANIKEVEKLVHVDCYRFHDVSDAHSIDLEQYFNRNNLILVIEWPEKIASILPEHTKILDFSYVDEHTRKIQTQ